MRTYIVIPTYWTGPDEEWTEGDAVYDHATPLNSDGTLIRLLQSIDILEDKHFTLIILAASTNSPTPLSQSILDASITVTVPVGSS